jgi:hypothetical protein
MFWQSQPSNSSRISELLSKDDLQLKELLDDEYLIEELKCNNTALIEYLTKEERLTELCRTALTEPEGSIEDVNRYRYCHLSSEVLTVDEEAITNAAVASPGVRSLLAGFFLSPDTLSVPEGGDTSQLFHVPPVTNSLLCSFFSRILCLLCIRQPATMVAWLESTPQFLSRLCTNLGSSALMDLVFRLVSCVEKDEDLALIKKWLAQQQLGELLVSAMCTQDNGDVTACANAAYLSSELIRHLREAQFQQCSADVEKSGTETRTTEAAMEASSTSSDPLLGQLTSRPVLARLLDNALKEPLCDSTLRAALEVFSAILHSECYALLLAIGSLEETTRPSVPACSDDQNRICESLLVEHLPDFDRILRSPPKQSGVGLPCTFIATPFGQTRLQVLNLLTALLTATPASVHRSLVELGTLPLLLGYFVAYPMNNLLHTALCNLICGLLTEPCSSPTVKKATGDSKPGQTSETPSPLLDQLFDSTEGIIPVILKAVDTRSSEQQAKKSGLPYFGHMMLIANAIATASEGSTNAEHVKRLIEGHSEEVVKAWNDFRNGPLAAYNKLNEADVVTAESTLPEFSDNIDREDGFPLDSADVAFANFRGQKMTKEFPERFGVSAAEILADKGDVVDSLNKKTNVDLCSADKIFGPDEIAEVPGEAAFEKLCQTRIQLSPLSAAAGKLNRGVTNDDWPFSGEVDLPNCPDMVELGVMSADTDCDPSGLPSISVLDDPGRSRKDCAGLKENSMWADFASEGNPAVTPSGASSGSSDADRDSNWVNFETAAFGNTAGGLGSNVNESIATGYSGAGFVKTDKAGALKAVNRSEPASVATTTISSDPFESINALVASELRSGLAADSLATGSESQFAVQGWADFESHFSAQTQAGATTAGSQEEAENKSDKA